LFDDELSIYADINGVAVGEKVERFRDSVRKLRVGRRFAAFGFFSFTRIFKAPVN
jgi:hypothetical protein